MAKRNDTPLREPRPKPELQQFAAWLRRQMAARKLGNNALAQRLGVSTSAISQYRRALRRPRRDAQEALAAFFKVPLGEIEALLPTESERFGPETPVAGSGTLSVDLAEEVGAYVVGVLAPLLPRLTPRPHTLEEWTRHGEPETSADVEDARVAAGMRGGMSGETGLGDRRMYWRVRITGRCMEPAIPDGGWVLVEPRQDCLVGDTVVVVLEDDQRVCKRVVLEDGELMLRADDDTLVRPGENGTVLGVVRYVPMPKRVAAARSRGR